MAGWQGRKSIGQEFWELEFITIDRPEPPEHDPPRLDERGGTSALFSVQEIRL